jgi:hypothetical protein
MTSRSRFVSCCEEMVVTEFAPPTRRGVQVLRPKVGQECLGTILFLPLPLHGPLPTHHNYAASSQQQQHCITNLDAN